MEIALTSYFIISIIDKINEFAINVAWNFERVWVYISIFE